MSANRLASTAITAPTTKNAITGLGSALVRPLENSEPIDFQPNTRSVSTAPPIRPAMSNATTVAIGISALRKACRMTTVRSVRPLDLAVRM